MHATFCVTRHPLCGVEKFKDLNAPQSPTIAAAASFETGEKAEEDLIGGPSEWPEMQDLAERGKLLDSEPSSPKEDEPKKKKGRKSGGKVKQPEPEPESSAPETTETESES